MDQAIDLEATMVRVPAPTAELRHWKLVREADGLAHVFYGVIEDGMDEAWRALVGADRPAPAPEAAPEGFDESESVPGPDPE